MARIPFIHARVRTQRLTANEVANRLRTFLLDLRKAAGPEEDRDLFREFRLTPDDHRRIERRAKAWVERVDATSGLAHLSREDVDSLRVLSDGARLVAVASEHRADEIGAILEEEMPWMNPANEAAWSAMRRSVRRGDPGLRLPPMLLVGPAGIGKSRWARRLAELIEAPSTVIDATGEPASFAVIGSQRGWGTAGPGRLVLTCLASQVANPVMIIDEIEKAGDVTSSRGIRFTLTEGLLPLLERSTAADWSCPYYRVRFDMSWVSWVMTANGIAGIGAPFLSRCPPLHLEALTTEHLAGFARREARRRDLDDEVAGLIVGVIEGRGVAVKVSLRTVIRMLERAEEVADRPALQ